ncbi:helix-turn-helix transcriptional regulator [Solirubrobacter soli]|uniref:helix-turn-helix transcriptional regulator n=1 Tax=Solirubrobacter soli TaxID=363832 RepID=UPI000417E8A5|nr:helix-turn-helix transcriptional regulator [Solirubrobacter soli]
MLIGRELEWARLQSALDEAAAGRGGLLLLSGEAGVGKTRLVAEALGGARFFRGAASPSGSPYGPVVGAFREYLRAVPGGLDRCGPLRNHLAVLLPELGEASASGDRATLVEAIRCGLVTLTAKQPAALLLDDLQWSDDATIELLSALALPVRQLPLLIVAAYRSDELPRAHPLRRLRHDLRRDRALEELTLESFDEPQTGALFERLVGTAASPRLTRTLHDRTCGIPFFIEELTAALQEAGRLTPGAAGLELALDDDVPLPATVRDAVLVRIEPLSERGRAAAETAAVAGARMDLALLAGLAGEDGVAELLATGLLVETAGGEAAFRHPLVRDAVYEDVPWLRRRTLHRSMAEAVDDAGEVAAHWLAARDSAHALNALRQAIADRAAVHAYRDATRLGRQAFEIWPEGEQVAERVAALEQHARYAELAGDLTEAARAQRDVVAARRSSGAGRALADAERRMASIYELQGDRERALAARRVAAEAFAANDLPGEAAAERLVIAGHLQSAGLHDQARASASAARVEALRAERPDLQARALGLEGVARAKAGAFEEGLAVIQEGLSLALERQLTPVAAEVYQRLGTAKEIAGDYDGARDALGLALGLCDATGDGLQHTCLSCMTYVLRELGDWDEAAKLCRELLAPGPTPQASLVADGILGAIEVWRGHGRRGLPLLVRCLETSARLNVVSMQCDSAAALAWLAAAEGDLLRAEEHCRVLLARWERSQDHHYAVWGLRWAAGHLARSGRLDLARACSEALASIVASAGYADALAALASAIAETALAEGDADAAAPQFARAAELHGGLNIPFERAQILVRGAAALSAIGERDAALDGLTEAHRVAVALGARPLAAEAASAVAALGASVADHLGRRAAAEHETAGLSRREVEVVRLVAQGLTNREIAARLVLSTRTVDMHVRNILTKLRSHTRTEAAARATELGLLEVESTAR